MKEPDENIDYYLDENGFYVFTEKYHLERGYCCFNGCRHCPYKKVVNNHSSVKIDIEGDNLN